MKPRYVKSLKGWRCFSKGKLRELIQSGTCYHRAPFAHLNYSYKDVLQYFIERGYQKKSVTIEPDDIRVPYHHVPRWFKPEE